MGGRKTGEVVPGMTVYLVSGRIRAMELTGSVRIGRKAAGALAQTGQHSTPPGHRSMFPSVEGWVWVTGPAKVKSVEPGCVVVLESS